MPSKKGAVHIPIIIVVVAVSIIGFIFKDKITNFVLRKETTPVEVMEREDPPDTTADSAGEVTEEEKASVFGDLLTQGKIEPLEPSKPANAASAQSCDLTQYMQDPEYSMPFESIITPLPEEETPYPEEWPQEFIYPESFKLVDKDTGKLSEEGAMMYKAFMIYETRPYETTCSLVQLFEKKGWQVTELVSRENMGFIVVLKDADGVGTGLLNVEKTYQDNARSYITLSVFPDAIQSE